MPIDAGMDIDINTIPAAAVESVETITGGAAATYGSDAISGVVNFKLKQDFQGAQLDAQWGEAQAGDDKETKISALIGGNFAQDKGNAMVSISYANRTAVFNRDRKFFSKAYTDPTVAGDYFPNIASLSGPSALQGDLVNYRTYPYSQAALDSIFGAGEVNPLNTTFAAGLGINPAPNPANATVYYLGRGASGTQAPGFINPGTTVDGAPVYKYVDTNNFTGITTNPVNQMLSLPLTRYSVFTKSHYDINDNITAYMQANFVENETLTILGSNPAVNQYGVFIPYNGGDGSTATITQTDPITGVTTTIPSPHLVPPQVQALLQSRTPDPTTGNTQTATSDWELGRGLSGLLGPRSLAENVNTYQVIGGFKGNLPFGDWTYDIYGSHGNTAIQARYSGFANLANYQALIRLPNYGANADISVPNRGTFAHCTSGLNPFSSAPVSQDCLDIINAPITTTTDVQQDVVEGDFQGGLFNVPAGQVRGAVGADYRMNSYAFRPDPLMAQTNIVGATVGIFGANASSGVTKVAEGYAEALIPVLKDLPLVKLITLDAGYRYSSYDIATVGGVSTWKITGDWSVVNWLKFRGGYQLANRAPNTAELFQGGNTQVIFWPDGDPCVTGQNSYGNTAGNPNRAKVQALCTALSGGYVIGDNFGTQSPFVLSLDNQTGNPNLTSESAKTWTIGTVVTSPIQTPLLSQLTASIDYYNIGITKAIGVLTSQSIYRQCFNANGTSNPTYTPSNFYCSLIVRSPTDGTQQTVRALYANLGGIKTAGVDVQVNWAADLRDLSLPVPGSVSVNFYFNWLDYYKTQAAVGQSYVDYAGSGGDGTFTGGLPQPLFKTSATTIFGYSIGPAAIHLRWKHLPGVIAAAKVTNPASTIEPTGDYDLFDLYATYKIGPRYELRAGIDNLFDRQPEISAANPVSTPFANATTGQGTTYNGAYDVLGRRFYIGANLKF